MSSGYCAKGNRIQTPISVATEKHQTETVKILLENGADPNIVVGIIHANRDEVYLPLYQDFNLKFF